MNAEQSSAEPDALERRLAGTPPRPAPAELRAAVLRAAANVGQAASLPAAAARSPALSVPSAPPAWWEHLLTRFPLATGGFATCWLIAWLGGSADRWLNGPVAAAPVRVSAEQVARAKAERAELRQLAGLEDAPAANFGHRPVAPSPAVPPRPRGDRRRSRDDGFGHLPAPDSISIA
jgi:hypothetical protein